MTTVNQRLSVHNVTFLGAPLADLQAYWAALGVTRLSILDSQLLDPEFPMLLQ
ncbi:MAG TPA: sugar phosphate isomerase/epimerase, partial [Mycobacterium sp.]